MAVRKAEKARSEAEKTTVDLEPRVVALAEQLGGFLGRVQAKADGWLDNEALRRQVATIRDGAADLLKHVNRASAAARASATKLARPKGQAGEGETPAPGAEAAAAPQARASRGAVDAPGKRHRKPPPQERIDKRMGEPVGKKMGQKQFKVGKSRGRG
jgi:hypothetical protein